MRAYLAEHAPRSSAYFAQTAHVQRLRKALVQEQPNLLVDMGAFRRALIAAVLQSCQEDEALVHPTFEVFYHHRNQVDHYPDTLDALHRLSAKYRLMAVTNGNADLHRVGIARFFEGSVGAADLGVAKPDARIFHEALARLHLAPYEVLHVGDDAHLDVHGAVNAGIAAIWLNRDAKTWPLAHPPTHEVSELGALCDWLGC